MKILILICVLLAGCETVEQHRERTIDYFICLNSVDYRDCSP